MQPNFPFSAIVGQDRLKTALLLISVDPQIGGVLLSGPRGSAKSTVVRGLANLTQNQPFVNVPLGASEEMITGSFDLEKALNNSEVAFRPGLLAKANGGILYVDEVNLLTDNLVDLLLDAAASGINLVERDGISHRHDAKFSLVGTMNPDEGELRPQLLDRFGLMAQVATTFSLAQRKQVVRQRLAYDRNPDKFIQRNQAEQDLLRDKLEWAKNNLSSVAMPDSISAQIAQRCADANVEGFRADLTMHRASCANAALNQQLEVSASDLEQVAPLVLAHRRQSPERKQPAPPDNSGASDNAPDDPAARNQGGSSIPGSAIQGSRVQGCWGAMDTVSTATAPARLMPLLPARKPLLTSINGTTSASAQSVYAGNRKGESLSPRFTSQPINNKCKNNKRPIDWFRTLGMNHRFAKLKYCGLKCRNLKSRNRHHSLKFRYPRSVSIELDLVLLDISASTLSGQGLSQAKGMLKALSQSSYRKRRQLSIITFGNDRVSTLLHPQRAPHDIQDKLDSIRAGGGTPAGAALNYAGNLLARQRYRHFECSIFLVTDGRLNKSAMHHALLSAYPITIVDIESSRIKLGQGKQLAEQISAQYIHVSKLPLA
ncbi:VWA domain-containing protein [Candidatus Spongiihabitans sp.]|uniref:VWA domain-containing protein n=1 Tax=Candidatus Spongiihabitans sp. TaxID=3101308 RepID=UPI003C6F42D8